MTRLTTWLIERFQASCKHSGKYVTTDITQGDVTFRIEWCARCGAYRYRSAAETTFGPWRTPRAGIKERQ